MPMRLKWMFAAAAIVVLAAVLYGAWPDEPAVPPAAEKAPVPAPFAAVGEAHQRHESLTPGTLVARLVGENTPQAAYAAYTLIDDCATYARRHRSLRDARQRAELERRDGDACDGLDDPVLQQRMALLERAFAGHVPGAAVSLFVEGLGGDVVLGERRDDPAVQAWVARFMPLMHADAERGERKTLAVLARWYEQEDLQQAMQYGVASLELEKRVAAIPPELERQRLERLSRSLTPEQAADAIAAGRRIAAGASAPAAR